MGLADFPVKTNIKSTFDQALLIISTIYHLQSFVGFPHNKRSTLLGHWQQKTHQFSQSTKFEHKNFLNYLKIQFTNLSALEHEILNFRVLHVQLCCNGTKYMLVTCIQSASLGFSLLP